MPVIDNQNRGQQHALSSNSRVPLAPQDPTQSVPMALDRPAQGLPRYRSGLSLFGQGSQTSASELDPFFQTGCCNQELTNPAHDASDTQPLNMDCPFHATVLQCHPPRKPLRETAEHRFALDNFANRADTSNSHGQLCVVRSHLRIPRTA